MAEPCWTSSGLTETGRSSDPGPSCSSLTTKELQQNLRAEKKKERPIRLMMEIRESKVIQHNLDKHVVYEIVVMRSGSFDSRCVSVQRRYSDFSRLHHRLLAELGEELEDLLLPRKLLTGNFSPEVISERRRALQDYLARLCSTRCVRRSAHFPAFLTQREQRQAHALLRAGQFRAAVDQLQVVLEIQEKLLPWQSPTLTVPTLCALAVCHRDLEQTEQAFATAQRALVPVRRYGLKRYRAPLLDLLLDLGYELGRPVAQIQEELTVLRDTERGEVSSRSLKELMVQEFI
ncbi:sorting nexin-20 [Echeneis naucrates]|uniref:PX domain-containing protein n=1 Tax=Echeneis naucrates TaxID=173247 RepID=A0A665UP14_ECHNA|nr:sorting nexin-20 [Echeneis naucrates]